MPFTPPSPLQATLAGTAMAHRLWQAGCPPPHAEAPAAQQPATFPAGCTLTHWTAAPDLPAPTGLVFWLPTPAAASAEERALEQSCRSQLMQAAMGSRTQLLVLYGAPPQQWRALCDCLQVQASAAMAPSNSAPPAAPSAHASAMDSAAWHGHAPGLRCRECLDPASEQRLFSRLLASGAPHSPER